MIVDFAKPLPKSRAHLSPTKYNVYLDGYPIDNPPVVVSRINADYLHNNKHIFDESLSPFSVFGIVVFEPYQDSSSSSGRSSAAFCHAIVQFNNPEDAQKWAEGIAKMVIAFSKLEVSFFGKADKDFEKFYGYAGKIPVMGGKPGARPGVVRYKKDHRTFSSNNGNYRPLRSYPDKQKPKDLRKTHLKETRTQKTSSLVTSKRHSSGTKTLPSTKSLQQEDGVTSTMPTEITAVMTNITSEKSENTDSNGVESESESEREQTHKNQAMSVNTMSFNKGSSSIRIKKSEEENQVTSDYSCVPIDEVVNYDSDEELIQNLNSEEWVRLNTFQE